jgi:hypothetical protein
MSPADVESDLEGGAPAHMDSWATRLGRHRTLWGLVLVLLCLFVYGASQPNRSNPYLHFVLQAQAWIDGNTSINTPGYQDVMPMGTYPDGSSCVATSDDADCVANGLGIIPFPPLPAWVLLPFVSLWGMATNQQLLAVVFAAIDVGIAYWMLGYLPVLQRFRVLTSLFLGLGSVLWYAAAIGSTWFWAHIVAVGCLLLSVGVALSADRAATEPEPLAGLAEAVRGIARWPGGRWSLVLLAALGASTAVLFAAAGRGSPAVAVAGIAVVMSFVAAALAVVVAGRRGVLAPFAIALAVVGGMPALVLAGTQSHIAAAAMEAVLAAILVGLWWLTGHRGPALERILTALWAALSSPESRQVAAGILFGLAVTARLTVLFGFPFLLLVGGGGNWLKRGMLAGAGVTVVLAALLVYTYAATGQLFNPAYQYQYGVESSYGVFAYHTDWSITDIRYIPQNLMIMLFQTPKLLPSLYSIYPNNVAGSELCTASQARGLFDVACPLMEPDAIGTSILLASPAFLLAPLAWRPFRHLRIDRVTAGATIAVLAIATVNLMHFSQGWVQFGYRFSNDFVPFALILVALGASRLGRLWPVVLLVGLSIVANAWGTIWGVALGW